MKTLRAWLAAGLVLAVGAAAIEAQTLPQDRLRQQQQVQRQVRTMARQLVGSVLDLQLQQLSENGLSKHPWYAEIKSMREHLDEMVETQMAEVLDLLAKVDVKDDAQREKVFQVARTKSRDIVIRLLVERQSLLRRLKIAEMAAQVLQLIELQTKTLDATESLPEQPASRRQAMNLTTIEDQRDIKATFGEFKTALTEVSQWTGPFADEAAVGLQKLEKHQLDKELASAETHLQSAEFDDAATNQKAVIAGLRDLLEIMRNVQKIADRDSQSLQKKIEDLIKKEQEIKKETEQTPPEKQDEADKLAAQQTEVRKEIAELRDVAQNQPEVKAPLEAAAKAAQEAAANLFEQKKPEAVANEEKVLKDLEQAAKKAEETKAEQAAKTPEQLEKLIKDLTGAAEDLKKAKEDQTEASKEAEKPAAEKADAAAKDEQKVAKDLTQATKDRELPKPVKAKIDEAKKDAKQAAAEMHKPLEQREKAAEKTERAIEQAQSETAAALADAQRAEAAAKVEQAAQAAAQADNAAQADAQKQPQADQAHAQLNDAQQQLAQVAKEQFNATHQLREKVEQALARAMTPTTERLQDLNKAREKVAEAQKEQAKAQAQPPQAAKEKPPEADKKAEDKKADDKKPEDKKAEEKKPEDKKAEDKKPDDKKPDEKKADEKHEEAKPDMAAQAEVTQKAHEAAELAQAAAPDASATLDNAAQTSDQARQEAAKGDKPEVAQKQEKTADLLKQADKQLQAAIRKLEIKATEQLAQEHQESGQMAQEAVPIDPKATADLQKAEDQSQPSPADLPAAQEGVRQDYSAAAADLAAREAEIAGDVAQAMAHGHGHEPGQPGPHSAGGSVSQPGGTKAPNQPSPMRAATPVPATTRSSNPGGDSPQDATTGQRKFLDEPWFARLPPELRSAIRNNAQRQPPRGYEERLQRYFENLD